jgi:Replicase family/Primase C terminal 1 (PriCT-1)
MTVMLPTAVRDRLLACLDPLAQRKASVPLASVIGRDIPLRPDGRPRKETPSKTTELAKAIAPHLVGLAEFLLDENAPHRPLQSQTIRAVGVKYRVAACVSLRDAITSPWMAWDTKSKRNIIAVDIDHPDGLERAEALAMTYGLPQPTLIVCPWSGRSHAIWRLAEPVLTGERARRGPHALCDRAGGLLAAALGGTLLPQQSLLKSPWGQTKDLIGQRLRRTQTPAVPTLWEAYSAANTGLMWHVIPGDFRLLELRAVTGTKNDPSLLAEDYGEVAPPSRQHAYGNAYAMPQAFSSGRNCSLFDEVRLWAYRHNERDPDAILAEAERVNASFCAPLAGCEVRSTANSIARYMATTYQPAKPRRTGRMTISERNALASKQAAIARVTTTERKIADGIAKLQAEGRRITQVALAAAADVSLSTIKRRWPTISTASEAGQDGVTPSEQLSGSMRGRGRFPPRQLAIYVGRPNQILFVSDLFEHILPNSQSNTEHSPNVPIEVLRARDRRQLERIHELDRQPALARADEAPLPTSPRDAQEVIADALFAAADESSFPTTAKQIRYLASLIAKTRNPEAEYRARLEETALDSGDRHSSPMSSVLIANTCTTSASSWSMTTRATSSLSKMSSSNSCSRNGSTRYR